MTSPATRAAPGLAPIRCQEHGRQLCHPNTIRGVPPSPAERLEQPRRQEQCLSWGLSRFLTARRLQVLGTASNVLLVFLHFGFCCVFARVEDDRPAHWVGCCRRRWWLVWGRTWLGRRRVFVPSGLRWGWGVGSWGCGTAAGSVDGGFGSPHVAGPAHADAWAPASWPVMRRWEADPACRVLKVATARDS